MKKISYKEAAYIRRYKKNHFGEKYLCNWYIEKNNSCSGTMRLYVKWWAYILAFIPVHLIQMVWCMWDGGLKEFGIEPRMCNYSNIVGISKDDSSTEFGRFKEVWEKHSDNV